MVLLLFSPAIFSLKLKFNRVQYNIQYIYDFARVTDDADNSFYSSDRAVVALLWACSSQQLSPWGRPFSLLRSCYRSLLKHRS